MSIKRVERNALEKFKPGWKRDRRSGSWYTWQVDYYEKGVRKRKRGFYSEDEAKAFLRDTIASEELERLGLVSKRTDFPTLREILEQYLGEIKTKRERIRSARVYRTFVGMFPADIAVDVLRTKHFKDYADKRLREKVKAETVNRELTTIRSALKRAYLAFPVLEDWEPPKGYWCEPEKRAKRERAISREDEEKVLAWLKAKRRTGELEKSHLARIRTAAIFEFALLTGLRHGEIVQVKKSDVGKKELTVFRPKTGATTVFPMTDDMKRVIAEASKLFTGEYVFSTGGIVQGKTWHILKKACEAVGVPYGRDSGLVLHSTRHTFVSRLVRAGVDIATIQSLSSHSDMGMVMKYSHTDSATKRKALDVLTKSQEKELRAIWKKVRDGSMDLETFLEKVSIY